MAEDQAKETKPKRRVKNPETFRERALKSSATTDSPKRGRRLTTAFGRGVRALIRPLFRGIAWVFGLRIFWPLRKFGKLLGKVLFVQYFVDSWRELKLVTWPKWKQSNQLTLAVLIFAVVFGAVVAVVDYGLDKVFRQLLLK